MTVRFSREDVLRVARLARISLGESEADAMAPQLGRVLDHIAELEKLDLGPVPPTRHVVPLAAPLRPDAPHEGLRHAEAVAEAPEVDPSGAFVVPRFVEG